MPRVMNSFVRIIAAFCILSAPIDCQCLPDF